MARIDHVARPTGPPDDDGPSGTWGRRLARLRMRLQDRLWNPDEKWAAERGYTSRRSARGWSVDIHDPRFDRRHVCFTCAGSGRHRITGTECADCDGVGVVTDPERGERA
jgi:hypothetical protein